MARRNTATSLSALERLGYGAGGAVDDGEDPNAAWRDATLRGTASVPGAMRLPGSEVQLGGGPNGPGTFRSAGRIVGAGTPGAVEFGADPINSALEGDMAAGAARYDDPFAAADREDQIATTRATRGVQSAIENEPGRQTVADIVAKRGALRYLDPDIGHQRWEEQGFKRDLATLPATIAAQGREDVANIAGQSKVQAALANRRPAEEIIAAQLDDWTRSGVFGVDRMGRPIPPPPDVQSKAHDLLLNLFGKASGSAGQYPPEVEAMLTDAVAQGLVPDRASGIAELTRRGVIK